MLFYIIIKFMNNTARIVMVETQAQFKQALAEISQSSVISIDTESNSLFAYQEEVCLIQISTKEKDFLIDPLKLSNILELNNIFKNPDIVKIFHAAEYDLICLWRDYGFEFDNIFDTMIAARVLGIQAVGLGNLLKANFNIETNKKFQRANWGKRPLTQEMQNYAVLDTRYLFKLRNIFTKKLINQNLLELAEEDFVREIKKIHTLEINKGYKEVWRYPNAKDLSHQQLAILQALAEERDMIAQMKNQPLFKIIDDRRLVELALLVPQTKAEIEQHTEIPQKLIDRYSHWILKAIKQGILLEPITPPRTKRPSEEYLNVYYALREWRKNEAKLWGVESDVILPRDVLIRIAKARPKSLINLQEMMVDVPWRYKNFHTNLFALIRDARRVIQ